MACVEFGEASLVSSDFLEDIWTEKFTPGSRSQHHRTNLVTGQFQKSVNHKGHEGTRRKA
jgi:hypothetical protein